MVTVHDIRNVVVSAGASPLCKVGQSRAIHVSTNQAGCAELQAKLTRKAYILKSFLLPNQMISIFDIS